MICLSTSKQNVIKNHQDSEISEFNRKWIAKISNLHPLAKPRTAPSPVYNCHGLTFASRRTRIEDTSAIDLILKDDCWEEVVNIQDVLPGDVVIYFSDEGEANHSGIVIETNDELILPIVFSKWGSAGEFIHALRDCPDQYGPTMKFFRCRL